MVRSCHTHMRAIQVTLCDAVGTHACIHLLVDCEGNIRCGHVQSALVFHMHWLQFGTQEYYSNSSHGTLSLQY